jgi:hypothetical protein
VRAVASPPVTAAPKPVAALGGWIEAARALRDGDYATAERAFDDLARADDAPTRDEARLARAQIWIAEGRTHEARPELESLATSGSTERVRDRASALVHSTP